MLLYCETDYRTKATMVKELGEGKRVGVFNPGVFGATPEEGIHEVTGPHGNPKWTARVELQGRRVVEVLE